MPCARPLRPDRVASLPRVGVRPPDHEGRPPRGLLRHQAADQRPDEERHALEEDHEENPGPHERPDHRQRDERPEQKEQDGDEDRGDHRGHDGRPDPPAFLPPTKPTTSGPKIGIQNSRMESPIIHSVALPTEPPFPRGADTRALKKSSLARAGRAAASSVRDAPRAARYRAPALRRISAIPE